VKRRGLLIGAGALAFSSCHVKRYHILPVRSATPLQILTTNLPAATVGVAYSVQVVGTGGAQPYTWSLASASPNTGGWLSISAGGLLSGTPGTAETETIVLRVTDAAGTVVTSGNIPLNIMSASGASLVHGQSFTITGSGFGSKASNLPPVWDNCSHGQALTARWDYGVPFNSPAIYNINYRTPAALGRGVLLPHNNDTSYLCGCHATGTSANDGAQVGFGITTYTRAAMPTWSYMSFYHHLDPAWVSGIGSPNDKNHKIYDASVASGPYNGTANWYFGATGSGPQGLDTTLTNMGLGIGDDSSGVYTSTSGDTYNSHSFFTVTELLNSWTKNEISIRWSPTLNQGKVIWVKENDQGNRYFHNDLFTDGEPGNQRCDFIGGYSRDYPNVNNYRYWADIWWEVGPNPGRFILANSATYNSATIAELQPYTPGTWSDSGATLTCNKGKLSSGTVHLHYRNDETLAHQYLGAYTMT
jgi:hypothetical protein